MATIYKDNTNLLTVGETKRLIIGAMPTEMAASVFASFNEKGEVEVGSLEVGEPRDTCMHASFIDIDFPALCQQQDITPRYKYRPVFTDYSGAVEQDAYYTITHDEFVQLARLFGATVEVGTVPAQEAATSAPVGAVSASGGADSTKAGPLPLTTGDIAFCFAGLRWNEQQWKKPLGDKPKWLLACIAIPGVRGVSESRWNPVRIGAWLVSAGHAKPKSVRAKFQTQPLLKHWRDEWKTYEADNLSAD